MAVKPAVLHGTDAGYRAELESDSVCDRCRKAHQMYMRSVSSARRGKGTKLSRHEVIDHLWTPAKRKPGKSQAEQTPPYELRAERVQRSTGTADPGQAEAEGRSESQAEPSLAERMGSLLGRMQSGSNDYVPDTEIPEYLHSIEPDADPADGEWSEVRDEQIVITAHDRQLIEENLGTYLSVIGMTLEIVDPYCGPILAENLEEMVKRWTKVIAHYPRAAHLFMSKGGGMIMEWIGAIQATWPILFAIYEHHLARTIQTDGGKVYRVRPSANGHPVDATMPPQSDFDYTVN